jgi:fumigallin biosynthesis monooxygenase-like protein
MGLSRQTVNLEEYPDLVVIYLGMYVRKPKGILRLLGLGPQIDKSWRARPDGLLLHENLIWSLFPPHLGMRQYWRDLDSLERWTRSEPHRRWWLDFARDSGGTGFWHEAYFMRGGIDAIYDDLYKPLGLGKFAPTSQARGRMFSARNRAGRQGTPVVEPVIPELELYPDGRAPVTSG